MKDKNGVIHSYLNNHIHFEDKEWDEAMAKDEKPVYYRCTMYGGGTTIKLYKPSIATLVMERTGLHMEKM